MNFDYTKKLINERLKFLEQRLIFARTDRQTEMAEIINEKVVEMKKAIEILDKE